MVLVGLAVTELPVDELKLPVGDQAYVVAPLAVKLVELPLHILAAPEETVTVGNVFTVTATVFVFTHPFALVPVTVYVVVTVGLATTVAPVLALNPLVGDHA